MQVNPISLANLAPSTAAAVQTLRVMSGDLTTLQSSIVAATVGRIQNGQAELNVGGKVIVVRESVGLATGDVLNLRVTGGKANPQLEVLPQTAPSAAAPALLLPRAQGNAPQVSVVDVLSRQPNGQVVVNIDGQEVKATSQEPLQPGGRYVALVERTVERVTLKPVPDTPELPKLVAAAILRVQSPAPLAEAVPPLLQELDAVPPIVLGQKASPQQVAAAEIRSAIAAVTPKLAAPLPATPPAALSTSVPWTPKAVFNGPEFPILSAAGATYTATAPTPFATQLESTPRAAQTQAPTATPLPAASSSAPPEVRDLVTALTAKVLEGASTPELQQTIASFVQKFPALVSAPEVQELLQAIPKLSTPGVVKEPASASAVVSPPITPEQVRAAIRDGGQLFEAKLGREASGETPPAVDRTPDLKGGLLRLLQAVPTLAHAQFPVAVRTLESIEAQQAQNVFAQETGGAYVFQVPFVDGDRWRTLNLSLEPEYEEDAQGEQQAKAFRMMMQVPLTDMGETWVEAGLNDNRLFAVVYVQSQAALDRLRPELPALKTELLNSGFSEALVDVRNIAELPEKQKKRATAQPNSGSIVDVRV